MKQEPNGHLMRFTRTTLFALLAVFAVVTTAVVVVAATRGGSSTERVCANDPSTSGCPPVAECNPERPACQEQKANERLRRYCAENPRDAKCR